MFQIITLISVSNIYILLLFACFNCKYLPTYKHSSLILTTNVDLGNNKSSILKELSSLVATTTGKPESYVAISVTDKASMVFGGSDAPLALGCMYSLGAINKENNGKIQSGVTDVLEKYGVKEDRIYINFFDMARGELSDVIYL